MIAEDSGADRKRPYCGISGRHEFELGFYRAGSIVASARKSVRGEEKIRMEQKNELIVCAGLTKTYGSVKALDRS